MPLPKTVLCCSYIYHGEELPELPSQISAILSTHLLMQNIKQSLQNRLGMNKPVYLGQAILDLSKTLMYEFHYDYMKSRYGSKVNLCYIDSDCFVYEIVTKDFYRDIAKDVKKRFDASVYSKNDNRPLPIGENKKVIGLMKDELGGKIMAEFVALRAKM